MLYRWFKTLLVTSLVCLALLTACGRETQQPTEDLPANDLTCEPTPADMLGPFYEAGAPIRDNVGEGYRLSGFVKSAEGCTAIAGAQVEFWLAGPDGIYSDDYRATLFSDETGAYQFESHFPPAYSGRPPHIHIRVTAPEFEELVTQHYPVEGETGAAFDLVLSPND